MSDATLLPPNSTPLERAMALTTARLSELPVPITHYIDPDTCPASLLPWLAWELSVDEWDDNWSEAQKRATIKASPYVHMKKGTPAAIRRALESLGYTVRIVTRRDERMAPHAFRVEVGVSDTGINEALHAQVLRLIQANKNTRSYLTRLTLIAESPGSIYIGMATLAGHVVTVYPRDPTVPESEGFVFWALFLQTRHIITVYPKS